MRKLLFVGVMIFCVGFVNAQEEDDYKLKETVIKTKDDSYNDIEYMEKHFGDAAIGEIFKVKPGVAIEKVEEPTPEVEETPTKEVAETPQPETKSIERSSSSRNVTSSGSSSSSSTRKSTSRKRTKRKKISFKRKRPKRMKRKRKMGKRAVCPTF